MAIRIPKLVARDTSFQPLLSEEVVEHPFIIREIEHLGYSELDVFNQWQPNALQPRLAALTCVRYIWEHVHRIVRFPDTNDPTIPPSVAVQSRRMFKNVSRSSFIVDNSDNFGILAQIQEWTAKVRARTDRFKCRLRLFTYNQEDHNYSDSQSRIFAIDNLVGDDWPDHCYTVGPVCLGSGTVLLARQGGILAASPTHLIVVLRFE